MDNKVDCGNSLVFANSEELTSTERDLVDAVRLWAASFFRKKGDFDDWRKKFIQVCRDEQCLLHFEIFLRPILGSRIRKFDVRSPGEFELSGDEFMLLFAFCSFTYRDFARCRYLLSHWLPATSLAAAIIILGRFIGCFGRASLNLKNRSSLVCLNGLAQDTHFDMGNVRVLR